jgi:hypothetical protein
MVVDRHFDLILVHARKVYAHDVSRVVLVEVDAGGPGLIGAEVEEALLQLVHHPLHLPLDVSECLLAGRIDRHGILVVWHEAWPVVIPLTIG